MILQAQEYERSQASEEFPWRRLSKATTLTSVIAVSRFFDKRLLLNDAQSDTVVFCCLINAKPASIQGIALEEFFTSTEGHFQTPLGKALAKEVIARRAPPALDLGPQGPGSIGKSAAAIAAAQAQAAAAAEAAAAAAAMAGRAGEADAVAVAPKIDSGAGGL